MPILDLTIQIADYEPVSGILSIIGDRMDDDRIPQDYKFKINKALAPYLNAPKSVTGGDPDISL